MQIRRRSFFWQLFLGFLLVMLAANIGLYFYMVAVIKSYVYNMESRNIERESLVMTTDIDNNQNNSIAADDSFLKTLSMALDYRIWLINSDGAVIFDTSLVSDNNISVDSFKQALVGKANLTVTKNSHNESFLTVAGPVRLPGDAAGVLAVNTPISGINTAVRDVEKQLFLGGFLVAIASVLVAFYFTRKLTMPINKLISATEQVGEGNYRKVVVEDTNNELHDLSISFNQMIERLSQIDAEQKKLDILKKDFLSDLSHELRTPLTTLEAFLEALKDGMVVDEAKKHKYIVALYGQTMHLKRLTSDLLQLARIESGHMVAERVSFDPVEAIRSVVENRVEPALKKGNSLELSLEGEYPHIWCDRDHFRQIITNLINNAIQFTSHGTITVRASLMEKFMMVSVIDTGIGIGPHEIPYIWNRFFKVDKARSKQHQESGLGLSIVKKLVELHRGRVGVESTPGKGSHFYFLLPMTCEISARPEMTAAATDPPGRPAFSG
ncbi:MAG TPA: ATP-binding protein [Spirochaetia bacterium]|nr:ATP-binding protein [Spirochaetia bacterium]